MFTLTIRTPEGRVAKHHTKDPHDAAVWWFKRQGLAIDGEATLKATYNDRIFLSLKSETYKDSVITGWNPLSELEKVFLHVLDMEASGVAFQA
jgi:hypothetical protein